MCTVGGIIHYYNYYYWKTVLWFLKKIKNRTVIPPSNLASGIYQGKKNTNSKRYMTQMLTETLLIIVMIQKQSKDPSIDEWIKMCCVRTHTHTHTQEYYSVVKD